MNRGNRNVDKNELMSIIMESGFALIDLILYLDTHPYDKQAMELYDNYINIKNMAVEEYEESYGPITAYGVKTDNRWDWVNNPWPWEGACE